FNNIELLDWKLPTCDRSTGVCTFPDQYRLDNYVSVTGDEMVVPLDVMWNSWSSLSPPDERDHDMILHTEVREETARFVVPPGWELVPDSLPAPLEVTAPGVSVTLGHGWDQESRTVSFQRTARFEGGRYDRDDYGAVYDALQTYGSMSRWAFVLKRTTVAEDVAD